MKLEDIEYGVTRVTHENFPGEGTVTGPGLRGYGVMVEWDTPPGHLGGLGPGDGSTGEHGLGNLTAIKPTRAATGGPFDAGDTVRYVGPGFHLPAYSKAGVILDRVFTVSEGTTVRNGVIGLEGTSGALRAKYFELVTKAKPKPPESARGYDELAEVIWEASRADEGTISATGADHVASVIRGRFVVIDPAAVDVEALIDGAIKSAQRGGYWPDRVVGGHMIRNVMAALGIEAS